MLEFYGSESTKLAQHGLMREANETYLFHGTRVRCLLACQCVSLRNELSALLQQQSRLLAVESVMCSPSAIFSTHSRAFLHFLV